MTCTEVQYALNTYRPSEVPAEIRFRVSMHMAECVLCASLLHQKATAEGAVLSPEEKEKCDALAREYLKELLNEPD